MKRKNKIWLAVLFAVCTLACCVSLTACKNTCKIEWEFDDNVIVTAVGYTSLPTQLDEGTEVIFTTVCKPGYTIASISPDSVKSYRLENFPSDDYIYDVSYKFTVTDDMTVKIATRKYVPRTVAWMPNPAVNPDPYVTLKVKGYDKLPLLVEDGTKLTFTAECAEGYEVKSVSVLPEPVELVRDGNNYTVTVNKNLVITVIPQKIDVVTRLSTTMHPYQYVGETLNSKNLQVDAYYESGRVEEDVRNYKITYQNGNALSLGDTEFTLSYNGFTRTVSLGYTVQAKITLLLNGGKFSDEQLSALNQRFGSYQLVRDDNFNFVGYSWTFDSALESDVVLPVPEKMDVAFMRWSGKGVSNNKIPKNTKTNITLNAEFETIPVKCSKLEVIQRNVDGRKNVPFLKVTGKFIDADSVYLYLFGIENGVKMQVVGDKVTKSYSDNFVCELDLTEIAKYAVDDYDWIYLTIKIGAEVNGRLVKYDVDLNNTEIFESDFIHNGSAFYQEKGYACDFTLEEVTPSSWEIDENGINYTGKELLVNVMCYYQAILDYKVYEKRSFLKEIDGKAYFVIPGEAIEMLDAAELRAALDKYIKDIQVFSEWTDVAFTQSVVVDETDWTFEIRICLENITKSGTYIMHVTNPPAGDNEGNFNPQFVTCNSITVGGIEYSLEYYETGWGWDWLSIKCENL